ncbi:Hypothetical protein VCSRO58_3506 [Vibrio cholerae]|nr:Hypothetical protein VCSRO58_3506 [Vibrio cholerae]
MNFSDKHNARLRGWQRITLNSNATTETTAAQWDWKRYALTVPLEAFVIPIFHLYRPATHLYLLALMKRSGFAESLPTI